MKIAIITGIYGQDGTILCKYLNKIGYKVIGIVKKKIDNRNDIFAEILEKNIEDKNEMSQLLGKYMPDEFYHLAAVHFSSENMNLHFKNINMLNTNIKSVEIIIQSILEVNPECKFFYAGSSQMYTPRMELTLIDEKTPYSPASYYGITKVTSANIVKFHRDNSNLWGVVGILFNHESYLRSDRFISRKITKFVADKIVNKNKNTLKINNIKAMVDWSDASDIIDGIYSSLNHNSPDDYIFSSGKLHTVQNMIEIAFSHVNLEWEDHVEISSIKDKKNYNALIGNSNKAKFDLKWSTKIDFEKMIINMLENDIEMLKFNNYD